MCGIAGIYSFNIPLPESELAGSVRSMCLSQIRRGPDDMGYGVYGRVALGCSRLRITGGIEKGKQPLKDPWGNILVFNGELYDHPLPLLPSQHAHDSSDGMSLAFVLHYKGVDGLRHLSGMFAAAVYDPATQELLLMRDAVGEKPLYIKREKNRLLFASTVTAILEVTDNVSLRPEAVYEYLVYKSIGGHQSSFRDIDQLPPGSWMRVKPDGQVSTGKWWRFPDPEETASTGIEAILYESIKKRCQYDGDIGIFLSGGLDSGIVASVSSRIKPSPNIRLLSIGYDIAEMEDETSHARSMASFLGMQHEVIQLRNDDVPELFFQAATITEDPIQDPVVLSTILLAKHASTFTKVVLTGDGSDELWGGYARFDGFRGSVQDYLPRACLFHPQELGLDSLPASYLKDIELPNPALEPLDQVFRIELANRMRNYHLSRIDKICMDSGIEVRCPFLDIQVLELGLRLTARAKRPGEVPKGLLSSSFAGILPQWLVSRKKQPFSLPISQWLNGPLREYAHDVLSDPNSFVSSIIDPKPYLKQLTPSCEGTTAAKIWGLLQLEAWHQVFKNKL